MPRAFNKLDHQDPQALSHSPKCRPQRRSCLALAGSRMDDNQPFSFFWQAALLSGVVLATKRIRKIRNRNSQTGAFRRRVPMTYFPQAQYAYREYGYPRKIVKPR